MKWEEIVDQLLDRPEGWDRLEVGEEEEEEIAECLEAAERVRQLGEVSVPEGMAMRLEQSLRAYLRASALRPQQGRTPLEEADEVASHRLAHTYSRPGHRTRVAMFAVAAALVLAFTGLLALSALLPGSMPGAPAPAVQGTLTPTRDPQGGVQSNLALLQSALDDLRTVARERRDDRALTLALKTVSERTAACHAAVAAVAAGSQRTTARNALAPLLAQEEQTLRQLLPPLDWPLRLLFTRQLGVLGDPVPTVTQVTVQVQSAGGVLVTLTGTHFAPRARLVLNGVPTGQVRLLTAERLVGLLSGAQFSFRSPLFGVLNPDGTAAQPVSRDDNATHAGTPAPDD